MSMNTEKTYRAGLFSIAMIAVMGVSLIIPVLPDIERVFRVSPTEATLVITAYTLPGIVVALLCGVLSDIFGRKAVLLPGLTCFCLGGVLCAFSESFNELLFFRIIQGLGGGVTGVMYSTLVADRYQGHEMTRIMGQVTAVMSVGTAICPFVGGVLGEVAWYAPFLVTSLAMVAGVYFCFIPLKPALPAFDLIVYIKSTIRVARQKRILLLFVLIFLGFSIYYGPLTYFPSMADKRFFVSSSSIGLVYAVGSAGAACMAFALGWLSARFSLRVLMLCTAVCYGVSQVLMLFMPSLWWYMLPLCFCGLAQGLCVPIINHDVASSASSGNRASLLALNGSVFRASQSVAPFAYGLGWSFFGWRGPYMLGCVVAVLFGVLLWMFYRPQPDEDTASSL